MQIHRLVIISSLIMTLSACTTVRDKYGYFKDETQSYKKERPVAKAVVIPQNLSNQNIQDYYEVPQPGTESTTVPPIAPPGSNLTPSAMTKPQEISQQDRIRNAENAKIHGHTVATGPSTVGVNFSQAWSKVGSILKASNYQIVAKDLALGTYCVVDTSHTGGKLKEKMQIYQIGLKSSGNATTVSVSPSHPELQAQLSRSLNN